MVDWSNLPKDLLNFISVRLFSDVELKRFRAICSSWRSSTSGVYNYKSFPSRPIIHLKPSFSSTTTQGNDLYYGLFVSRAVFFRVTLSSSSSLRPGWLIKSDVGVNSGNFRLLDPFSNRPLPHMCKSLDLLEFTITEIQETYVVQDSRKRYKAPTFKRVVLAKGEDDNNNNKVLGVDSDGMIKQWKGNKWRWVTKIARQYSDIIVHKGLIYALDSKGGVWWISSSLDEICKYGPQVKENITNGSCGDMSFVECCGELYIVDRLYEENHRKRKVDYSYYINGYPKVVGFKVYKFDEELGDMVEVKSLGDKAFVMGKDTCFSVLAHEFYGCMQSSIYFFDVGERQIKVFKVDDNVYGSIGKTSECSQSACQMFDPSFF